MERENSANGFSLVELVVAIMVLAVGMLAMASATGYVSSEIRAATWNTQRSFARAQVIERLRAMPFDSVLSSSSATSINNFNVTWSVTQVNNALRQINVITSGPAYRLGQGSRTIVADTVRVDIVRP